MAAEPLKGPGGERTSPQDIGLPDIPGYRIEETLGRGSTGVVYRATQLAVDREVALKVLHPDLSGRPRAVRRLQREARTAGRLAHPNIVSAIDMGQVGALWWYAMELVEGESLAARLQRVRRLGEREALRLFTPLVDALDHAQRHGVVHRDIKPANILIDTSGRARLVDLGLAFREDDPLITNPGSTLGTPHYVSPEQARNPESADTRSDIWSLGATLYHAVCGRPPFGGDSVAEILSGVLYGRVTEPRELEPSLSRGLALVLRKCLSRDPARRYASPHELLEDLERCREKRPVGVQAAGLDPVLARRGWRSRLAWLVPASAALVLVGGWLARDVLAPSSEPAPGEQVADAPWPELEELARSALRPEAQPAPALVRLAELAPVPSRHRARYEQVEEALAARLRDAQAAFVRRLGAQVDRLVAQRDFVAALALLAPEGFGALARDELAVDEVQLVLLESRARPQELRRNVLAQLETHAAELERRIDVHVEQVVQARADNDVRAGLWRQAHARLSREPLELVADAGLVTAGLPSGRLDALLGDLEADLAARRAALEARWRALDGALAAWLEQEAARLETDLRDRHPMPPAAEELATGYARRCEELKLTEAQRLDEVALQAPRTLERLGAELDALERALLEEDARVWLADVQQQATQLRAERRYDELAELWSRELQRDWLRPVHDQVALELRAARLVQDLLERAARGVLALDGQTLGLLVRSIEVSGRLEAGSAPLELGFGLVAPDVGTVALALRPLDVPPGARPPYVLPPEAIERFAGLPSDPARTEDLADRLARALLRYDEGDVAGALACLPLPRSGDAQLDRLADRLRELVGRRDDELRQERERRLQEAEVRVNIALRMAADARHAGDREAAVRAIDELLASWGDLEVVRERAEELRGLRSELAPGRPPDAGDFRGAFGPTTVELADGDFALGFDFGAARQARWSRGAWREDAEGWIARGPSSLADVLAPIGWPSLVLGPPIDLDGPLEAAFTFEQPQDSGQPRLLVASVAGVHVVLRGEQGAELARVAVAGGGTEELRRLVEEVDGGTRGRPFPGLVRGERYTLAVSLSRQRGRADVRLWGRSPGGEDFAGEVIEQLRAPRPEGKPGDASVVLRSIEPVRLLEATLRGRAVGAY